jgi:hypothetical protein
MTWEERLLDLFDDLEQQAEGLQLAERDALVRELRRAEYAAVDLAARLHGSTGARVLADVSGLGPVDATLVRVGSGWCLLDVQGRDLIVVLAAVRAWRGLAARGRGETARPITARLGLGSVLRRLADERGDVLLHRADGSVTGGRLGKVGADFVELRRGEGTEPPAGYVEVVPFAAVTALRPG